MASAAAAWGELTRNLAECLGALEEDEVLILAHKHCNVFVQFAGQGWHGMRVEAAGNNYIVPPEALLTVAQFKAMDALGWRRATYTPDLAGESPDGSESQEEHEHVDGSPNFYLQAERGTDLQAIARMATQTLRRVYRIAHPCMLHYEAFSDDRVSIRFPTLHLKRREQGVTMTSEPTIDEEW
jgi:hypothetical protein